MRTLILYNSSNIKKEIFYNLQFIINFKNSIQKFIMYLQKQMFLASFKIKYVINCYVNLLDMTLNIFYYI